MAMLMRTHIEHARRAHTVECRDSVYTAIKFVIAIGVNETEAAASKAIGSYNDVYTVCTVCYGTTTTH